MRDARDRQPAEPQQTSRGVISGSDERKRPQRRLRIALLIYAESYGGMEAHAVFLARVLAARGHDVAIVEIGSAVFGAEQFADGGSIRVIHLMPSRPLEQVGLSEWWSLLRPIRADVAAFEKGWVFTGNIWLDAAARLRLRRLVTLEHLMPPPCPRRGRKLHFFGLVPGLGLWWLRATARVRARSLIPSRIIGVSNAIVEELARYGFPRRKLAAVPNGIDTGRYQPDRALRSSARVAWGVPEDALVFGTVGRLVMGVKGLDLALDLVSRLVRRNPARSFRYVVVGDGPDRGALEARVRAERLEHHVIFAGRTDAPWEAYPGLDVFLLPSRIEGLPLALLEAMACENCPIAMSIGGVPEVLNTSEQGWLIPPGDAEAFLEAMQAALEASPEALRAMGRQSRLYIERHFDARVQYAKVADLIENA